MNCWFSSCPVRFFSGYSGFPSPQQLPFLNSNSIGKLKITRLSVTGLLSATPINLNKLEKQAHKVDLSQFWKCIQTCDGSSQNDLKVDISY